VGHWWSGRKAAGTAVATALALAVAGCSATTSGHGQALPDAVSSAGFGSAGPGTSGSAPGNSPSSSTADNAACPAAYIAPDAKRPVTKLTFDIADNDQTVTGTERVSFTPDKDITEIVFRLTANTAPTVAAGNRIRVTSATWDHAKGAPRFSADGAAPDSQGGLLRLPLDGTVAAGTTISAELQFTLQIGTNSFDRFGRADDFVWFASAHPLLAWERGYGWHTEPMIQFTAESATSEAAQTDLTVSAPADDVVIASGQPADPGTSSGGRKTWHSTVDAARDVSVAAGPFTLRDADVQGVKVRIGAPDGPGADQVMADEKFALAGLTSRFGPFPFPNLSVALLPSKGGGIEYPSSILLLDSQRLVTVHETAHQWFYAMVGDSQAQHAWLDEAFASYAEQLVDGSSPAPNALNAAGPVDKPTADYGSDENDYYFITYDKGAAALHAARAAAGAAKFDAALRCYINANAWTIADPADLKSALSGLPAATAVLEQAGALR
jgi:hypothetical protein